MQSTFLHNFMKNSSRWEQRKQWPICVKKNQWSECNANNHWEEVNNESNMKYRNKTPRMQNITPNISNSHFGQSYRYKFVRSKDGPVSKISLKGFNFGNMIKWSTNNQNISANTNCMHANSNITKPININIRNININNYNYASESNGLMHHMINESSRKITINKCTTPNNFDNFPVIIPSSHKTPHSNEKNNNQRTNKNKVKKIKLVNMNNNNNNNTHIPNSINTSIHQINENGKPVKIPDKKIEVVEDLNDSFIGELTWLLDNVQSNNKENGDTHPTNEDNINMNIMITSNSKNQDRPQTSYGGLNDRNSNIWKKRGKSSKTSTN